MRLKVIEDVSPHCFLISITQLSELEGPRICKSFQGLTDYILGCRILVIFDACAQVYIS